MTVLDLSNHDFSRLNEACLKAQGVTRVIVGCWDLQITIQIVNRCRAVGILVEDLYCEVYNGLSYEQRESNNAISVQNAVGGIKRAWIAQEVDAAYEASDSTAASRFAATLRMDEILKPHFEELPGIYTYGFYWRNKVANTSAWASRRLWNSQPGQNDPNNPIPPIRPVAYGGWTLCDIHQYSSTIVVCERARDHNYWFVEEDAMGMTPQETEWVQSIANKVAVLEAIVAANGIDTDNDGEPDLFGQAALDYAYAPEQGWSAFLGITNNARALALHVAEGGEVFEHSHTTSGPVLSGSSERSERDVQAAAYDPTAGLRGVAQQESLDEEPDRGDPAQRFNRE